MEDRTMATYEVETDLIIHCRVKVTVDADTKEDAIESSGNTERDLDDEIPF
jgi:hypothetical protein